VRGDPVEYRSGDRVPQPGQDAEQVLLGADAPVERHRRVGRVEHGRVHPGDPLLDGGLAQVRQPDQLHRLACSVGASPITDGPSRSAEAGGISWGHGRRDGVEPVLATVPASTGL
jgi:hypothetical protein